MIARSFYRDWAAVTTERSVVSLSWERTLGLTTTQSATEVKQLVEAYLAAWNAHDVERIMRLHTTDTEYEWHGGGVRDVGASAVRARFSSQIEAMPNMRFQLRTIRAAEHLLAVETLIDGALGGAHVSLEAIDVLTMRNGLVVTKDTYGVGRR